jgi:hypothetical protein
MLILLLLLIVLLFGGLGFAIHLLWLVAVIALVVWLVGLTTGRSSSGRHHFYGW